MLESVDELSVIGKKDRMHCHELPWLRTVPEQNLTVKEPGVAFARLRRPVDCGGGVVLVRCRTREPPFELNFW